jgi:Protein of unknown function (DUF3105)
VKLRTTALERVAIGVASLVLSIGLIAILSGFFQSHDPAGVNGTSGPVGQQFADLGHTHLRPDELRPPYNSDPPTTGAHVPEPVLRDQSHLSNDQLLQALEVGDVVIAYGTRQPPPGLPKLAQAVAGNFTPALAAAGQAVILWPRRGTQGLLGLAWTRMLQVRTPGSLLQSFAERWLGRGAPGR